MKKQDLLEELNLLGLNEYKAKVFLALSSGKIMGATEIVEEAKITRGTIYDILKSFVEKGYCNEIETNRILQYQMIDPDVILDKITKEYTDQHRSRLTSLKITFEKVKANYSSSNDAASKNINIELIRGFNKHRVAKYKQLLETAKEEICGLYTFKGIVSDESNELTSSFIRGGGLIRSIYRVGLDFKIQSESEVRDAEPEDLLKVLKSFAKMGEQLRLADFDIPNMTIIDKENVFINVDDKWVPRQSQADVIFRHSNFAKYMRDLFEHYWNRAKTIEEYEASLNHTVLKDSLK